MIKYLPDRVHVVLEEIPDRVSLALDITNCPERCPGCHSPFLRQNIGEELTPQRVDDLLRDNFGVNCLLLLGEGRDHEALIRIAQHVAEHCHGICVALYSGRDDVEDDIWRNFDYVKTGPYIEALGPLNERTTNQRLYKVYKTICAAEDGSAEMKYLKEDITSRLWRKK